ncbi:MAG: ATP-binding protein [bacterium]
MADEASYDLSIPVVAGDFLHAGEAAGTIKKVLQDLNLPPKLVRRASICAYEAEMNIIIHARRGVMGLKVVPEKVTIVAEDEGPGIEDIDLAFQEGYSTAPDEIRELGFGAGMGLPNIKKCADKLTISSVVGQGTRLEIVINMI